MSKKKKGSLNSVKRLSLLNDEMRNPWLTILLDVYFVIDKGVASSLQTQQKKGRILACHKGCSFCCSTHKDIPLYPLELKGIIWYVTEKITGDQRDVLTMQLQHFRKHSPCPFLLTDICVIHPLRPMACRQFNVFGSPCKEGEDPFYTRREDVMDPVKKHVDQAFFIMLPYHGIKKESERVRIIETGGMHRMVRELHCCNWNALVEKMERYDKKNDK